MPIPKPPECIGCPFYELSPYITYDSINEDSEVLILGQAPGAHEEDGRKIVDHKYYNGKRQEIVESVTPQPLIGSSGVWLQDEFWPYTQIPYHTVSKGNVLKCRPYRKNDLPSLVSKKPVNNITVKMLKDAVTHCTRAHLKIPKKTKYVLSMGGIALYAMTGEESIVEWRGWTIGKNDRSLYGINDYYNVDRSNLNIFSTLHIAALFESPSLHRAIREDFKRFGKLVRGTWPKELPDYNINTLPSVISNYIGFDTEYDTSDNNRLEMFSIADSEGNIYVCDSPNFINNNIVIPGVQENSIVVGQNVQVDLPHFKDVFGNINITAHDCMYAWGVLFPGEPYSLDYMTSVVGSYNRHKHLRVTEDIHKKRQYAMLDAHTTLNNVWRYILQQFKYDPLSYREYIDRKRKWLYIIQRSQERGLKVYKERVNIIKDSLDKEMEDINKRAIEISGNPLFNIRSHQQVSSAIHDNDFNTSKEIKPKRKNKIDALIEKMQLELGV